MTDLVGLRAGLREAFSSGDARGALAHAVRAARADRTPQAWQLIHKELMRSREAGRNVLPAGSEARIALAASCTVDNLVPYLDVACLLEGLEAAIHLVPYNQFQLQIRDPASALHAFAPELTFLLADLPSLGVPAPPFAAAAEAREAVSRAIAAVRDLLAHHRRSAPRSRFLVANWPPPAASPWGLFESRLGIGVADFHRRVNCELSEALREDGSALVLDLDCMMATAGLEHARSRRMAYLARMPLAEPFAQALAGRLAQAVLAVRGRQRKCLVVDLDNVLWGGIVGEDGLLGVQIGDDPPGNVYRDIQRAVRQLYERGVILAIASKNNPDDALAVFEKRPEMVLRREEFAVVEIGWHDKVSSLRRIAERLNIGLDSLAFLDDNPRERAMVESELPEVAVLPFADDVAEVPDALLNSGVFDSVVVTEEDRRRGEMYAQRMRRLDAEEGAAGNLEEFLGSLGLEVDVRDARVADVPRLAQLTARTNQFNLTTRRYPDSEVMERVRSESWLVLAVEARDRFGDEGTVGLAMVELTEGKASIDTLLLSCRVIGRGVETALLATLAARARAIGARVLEGEFRPTKKNAQVREFYPAHGFQPAGEVEGGARFVLDLGGELPRVPGWIQARVEPGGGGPR